MSEPSSPHPVPPRPWLGWAVFLGTVCGVVALGLLWSSVVERRAEARQTAPRQDIGAWETDSAKWAVNWPREYASYRKMDDATTVTKYGGSKPRDLLAETPANVILFAGYAFAKDYLQARGHTHAVEDIKATGRINSPGPGGEMVMSDKTPATCWTCKSPDVPRLMHEMGGPDKFYAAKAKDLIPEVTHPIGCLDCHDPKTMALRISRPALVEAFQRQGKDISTASHQEMRSLVCAQCHVEYYFAKSPANYLTFPWDKGTGVDEMDAYYAENGFTDWTHPISGAKMIKMQHPDYEVYQKGIHAYRNVSCADCHMPYRSEGGAKFTDHHVQSPLNNIANSCAVCHRWPEDDIRKRVEGIQDKVRHGRDLAEKAIAQAHFDIAACRQAGADDVELAAVRGLIKRAQMRWDYVAANNGMGFHAPQECQRILGDASTMAQECRVLCARILAGRGFEVSYPDFGSKEKAQALIKLFIDGHAPSLIAKVATATPPATAP